jgi:hypothetical protein
MNSWPFGAAKAVASTASRINGRKEEVLSCMTVLRLIIPRKNDWSF